MDGAEWRISGELGRGSYGSVYLLTHTAAKSTAKFALKVIEEQGAGEGDGATARKELRIMTGLCHPSIVALVDSFQAGRRLLLVLELCPGGDLRTFLDQVKAGQTAERAVSQGVDESLILTWTQQLTAGLQYIHQKKILHRDLKPQNIFLKDESNLKIGDLGIARQLVFTKEMADTHIGTPLYISPEIYQGNSYSYKTDVWSLGCCVYEMLALDYAFHAPSRFQLVGKVVSKQVRAMPRCYSAALRDLVLGMLLKDPGERPHATDILRSLQGIDPNLQTPQEKRQPDREGALKPGDPTALQLWRLGAATALNAFLNRKRAIQSAQLAAALAERLSLDSIRDLQDSSGSDSSQDSTGTDQGSSSEASRKRQRQRRRQRGSPGTNSRSSGTGTDPRFLDSTGDWQDSTWSRSTDTISKSDVGDSRRRRGHREKQQSSSDSEESDDCKTVVSSSRNFSSISSSAGRSQQCDTYFEEEEDFSLRDTLSVAGTGQSRERHGQKDRRLNLNDSEDMRQFNTTPRQVKIGKSSMALRPALLMPDSGGMVQSPPPGLDDCEEVHKAYVQQVMTQARARLLTLAPPPPSPHWEEGGRDTTLLNNQSGGGGQKRVTNEGAGQKLLTNESAGHKRVTNESGGQKRVTNENRGHKLVMGETGAAENVTNGKRRQHHVTGDEGHLKLRTNEKGEGDQEDSVDHAELSEDSVAEAKQNKQRHKKRNFLKERKRRQTDESNVSITLDQTAPTVQPKQRDVTLYTRSQRVTFTKEKDNMDLSSEEDGTDLMARELGITTLRAAVQTAYLLVSNPTLLQFQLRELLGRENHKKYAAVIVNMAAKEN